jgi:hypothetical protein
MSFFKHVKLHEYDITDLGIRQACYDELKADGNNSDDKQLRITTEARTVFQLSMRIMVSYSL